MWVVKLGNVISICDVWLSLSVYHLLYHTVVFSPQSLHPCSFFTARMAPSSDRVKTSSAEDCIPASTTFPPHFNTFSHLYANAPQFFVLPLLFSRSFFSLFPLLQAEWGFQSQGPCASTPLTLREPCLRLSTIVHVCVFSVFACGLWALVEVCSSL